jgi:hypothetical protein
LNGWALSVGKLIRFSYLNISENYQTIRFKLPLKEFIRVLRIKEEEMLKEGLSSFLKGRGDNYKK